MIAVALRDVFQGVIVPRAENTTLRVSHYLTRNSWAIWPRLADNIGRRDQNAREDFLGTYAPFALMMLLVVWVVMLIAGWGLFFYGIRRELRPADLDYGAAVYYAGASMLTIGYGDIVAQTTLARMMSLVAGACGLGVVAVVISYLFALFGSFQERERFVVSMGARAGVPPSGIGLLETHAYADLRSDLAQVFRDGQAWTAGVMESHLAYPMLALFRSSHDYESWVGTVGTLMDAAALVLSTLDPHETENVQTRGQAQIMYSLGRHLASDFSSYFGTAHRFLTQEASAGVERGEFDCACERLRSAGYLVREPDAAWNEFYRLRAAYAPQLNALARWLEIPPLQWIGDRSAIARQTAHIA